MQPAIHSWVMPSLLKFVAECQRWCCLTLLGVEGILYSLQISCSVYVWANMRGSKRTEFRVERVNSVADSCRLRFLSVSFGRSNFSLSFPTFQCLMGISLAGKKLLPSCICKCVYACACVWQKEKHLHHLSAWKGYFCYVFCPTESCK